MARFNHINAQFANFLSNQNRLFSVEVTLACLAPFTQSAIQYLYHIVNSF
ncbi:hypothetical protein PSCICG_25370 [Pseudomonas cichorii]|nr:hypothetical protein PSCICG_25370 [Pseudomonas cichorii]